MGRIPALFMTLTAAIYKWERLNRVIRRWLGLPETVDEESAEERRRRYFAEANMYPEIVEWYVNLKLEMVLRLAKQLIARRRGAGPDSSPGDHFCAWEWGSGGMTHLHCVIWTDGSPRLDGVAADEKARAASGRPGLLLETEVAERMAAYFDEYISEVNPGKPQFGQEGSTRDRRAAGARDPSTVDWDELRSILEGISGDSEADFDARISLLSELVEFSNMHDWHAPFASGHPSPHQSCAKFANGTEGTDSEVVYCGKMFPRDPAPTGNERLLEDPARPELFRIWLRRNCRFVNNFNPLIMLSLLANMDIHGAHVEVRRHLLRYEIYNPPRRQERVAPRRGREANRQMYGTRQR